MEYDSKRGGAVSEALERPKMKRSGFGTCWFLIAMLLHAHSALICFTMAFMLGSFNFFVNGALTVAFIAALGVMVAVPQEHRVKRLIPLAAVLLLVLHTVLAARHMRDELYKYLLTSSISKELLDAVRDRTPINTREIISPSDVVPFNIYVGLSVDMVEIISRNLSTAVILTVGTFFSHESIISAWLTPFYLPKPAATTLVNNYFPSPPPC